MYSCTCSIEPSHTRQSEAIPSLALLYCDFPMLSTDYPIRIKWSASYPASRYPCFDATSHLILFPTRYAFLILIYFLSFRVFTVPSDRIHSNPCQLPRNATFAAGPAPERCAVSHRVQDYRPRCLCMVRTRSMVSTRSNSVESI